MTVGKRRQSRRLLHKTWPNLLHPRVLGNVSREVLIFETSWRSSEVTRQKADVAPIFKQRPKEQLGEQWNGQPPFCSWWNQSEFPLSTFLGTHWKGNAIVLDSDGEQTASAGVQSSLYWLHWVEIWNIKNPKLHGEKPHIQRGLASGNVF